MFIRVARSNGDLDEYPQSAEAHPPITRDRYGRTVHVRAVRIASLGLRREFTVRTAAKCLCKTLSAGRMTMWPARICTRNTLSNEGLSRALVCPEHAGRRQATNL